MSVYQVYPFNNDADYNKSNVEVTGGQVNLTLEDNPSQVFSQSFSSSSGFTFDSAKAEFTGGLVRQKDQTAAGSRLAATYTSSMDCRWNKDAAVTATLNGVPTLVGGKLSCINTQGLSYPTLTKPAGAVKFKYTPNYSGAPSTNRNMVTMREASGNNNRLSLSHSPSGDNFRIFLNDASGTSIYSATTIGGSSVNLTSGVEYEFELNWDSAGGVIRLFKDGVLHGTLSPGVFTRANGNPSILAIGANTLVYNTANASFDDVILFNTVQHTSGYTPGYTPAPFIYAGNKVDGPNFSYSGVGSVQSVDNASVTESGTPRYIVGLQFWNGSAWVLSNGTYTEANDFATAVANLGAIDVSGGGGILPWSIVFTDSNSLSSVDEFSIEVTGQKYSPLGYLEPITAIQAKSLVEYAQSVSVGGSTQVKVAMKIDGVLMYWDGAAWVTSDGSEAQSNTEAEFNTGVDALDLGSNSSIILRWILITSSNTATPSLEDSLIEYEFGAIATEAATCLIYGYYRDLSNVPIANATVKFTLNQKTGIYAEANKNIIDKAITVLTDDNGYFSTLLIRSSEYEDEVEYQVKITGPGLNTRQTAAGLPLSFSVPDAETKDITDLLPPA